MATRCFTYKKIGEIKRNYFIHNQRTKSIFYEQKQQLNQLGKYAMKQLTPEDFEEFQDFEDMTVEEEGELFEYLLDQILKNAERH